MIREPAVSGTFYPGNPKVLATDIENYLKAVPSYPVKGRITGLIVPHAGYMFSGQVAAYGYKTLSGAAYDTVIILAPSHRVYIEGAAIQEKGSYRTPLGDVPVDEEAANELLKEHSLIVSDPKPHRVEHAVEVQLPFLQVVLKDFRFVPLIMGTQEAEFCEALSSALYRVIKGSNKRFLVVGSTDLSHYHSYAEAVERDRVVVRHLEDFSLKKLIEDVAKDKAEACGAGPIMTTMMVSQKMGGVKSKVLKYANSGDVSGDKSSVVGYVSAVLYGEE